MSLDRDQHFSDELTSRREGGAPLRVLIVEDEASVALDLSRWLRRMGCTVVGEAATSTAALSLAEEYGPDLALMDVLISGELDGVETARLMQERLNIGIIYLTAYGDDVTLGRARLTNPYAYLLKPLRVDELRSALELAGSRRRMVADVARALASDRGHGERTSVQGRVSEQKHLQLAKGFATADGHLTELVLGLQHALRSKDSFVTRVSHELRTPLASILGFSDTLLMGLHGALNPEQLRHLRTIQKSAEHLLALINDLLDLSKLGAGELELKPELIDCAALIEDVTATLEPLAQGKGLRLAASTSDLRAVVRADIRAVRQILLNLIGNAIKFTANGDVSVTARSRQQNGRQWALLGVHDSGPGMCKADQERLFEPFFQSAAASGADRGWGLGLHLSRKLAERMGGTIRVESKLGRGSVFTLVLPQSADTGLLSAHQRGERALRESRNANPGR